MMRQAPGQAVARLRECPGSGSVPAQVVVLEAAGLDAAAGLLSLPVPDLEDSFLEPESEDVVVDSVFVSEVDESDPLDPLDFSEPDLLSWARVSVL
jgi:hypothetical protein